MMTTTVKNNRMGREPHFFEPSLGSFWIVGTYQLIQDRKLFVNFPYFFGTDDRTGVKIPKQ